MKAHKLALPLTGMLVLLHASCVDTTAPGNEANDRITIINDRIRTVKGVRETETSICLRVHKQTYNYGTPE